MLATASLTSSFTWSMTTRVQSQSTATPRSYARPSYPSARHRRGYLLGRGAGDGTPRRDGSPERGARARPDRMGGGGARRQRRASRRIRDEAALRGLRSHARAARAAPPGGGVLASSGRATRVAAGEVSVRAARRPRLDGRVVGGCARVAPAGAGGRRTPARRPSGDAAAR